MRVEIFRLTGQPVVLEVQENGTVRDAFSHPDSGKVLGREGNLLTAAQELYGSLEQLGTLRVNGAAASLHAPVTAGATILIIPIAVVLSGGYSAESWRLHYNTIRETIGRYVDRLAAP